MNDISTPLLLLILGCLILLSAFFSASETAMMAVNRYRLKSQADSGHRGARLTRSLLTEPDRLLGAILIGNNIANITATSIATVVGFKLGGNLGIAIATTILIVLVLVFAEVAPKTLAAQYPEKIAFPAAYILTTLKTIFLPLIWLVNVVSNGVLSLFGIIKTDAKDALNIDELRAAVMESSQKINPSYQDMLLGVLDMDNITVNDVMVATNQIEAINYDDEWDDIVNQIVSSNFTRLPVYDKSMDKVLGILHLRKILPLLESKALNKKNVLTLIREPYFIPENLPITQTLKDLKREKRRFALVVDEYGSLKGLITMEEILEEIVGDFTQLLPGVSDIQVNNENAVTVNGNVNIRDINRKLGWNINTQYSKTIGGLILHFLEEIPKNPTCLKIDGFILEIIKTSDIGIDTVKIFQRKI